MKNFNFANLISKLCSSVHSIFNTKHVELLQVASLKSTSQHLIMQKTNASMFEFGKHKSNIFKQIILVVCLLFFITAAWAQSFRTPTFTGSINDFNAAERFAAAANNTTYAITFDGTYMYFGAFRTTGVFGDGDEFAIYLDTDPRNTPASGNGTTAGRLFNGFTPTLPFNADYSSFTRQNYTDPINRFNGSWASTGVTPTVNVGAAGSNFREVRIALSDLGNPASVYVTMWMGYSGGIFSNAPGLSNEGTAATRTMTGFFGSFPVYKSGITPVSFRAQNTTAANGGGTAISNLTLALTGNNNPAFTAGDYGDITVTGAFTSTLTGNASFTGSYNNGSGTTNVTRLALSTFTLFAGGRGVGGTAGQLVINGSSGTPITTGVGGTIAFLGAGLVSGANTAAAPLFPASSTVTIGGAVDFGSVGATTFSQLAGTLQINANGSVNTNPPTYNAGSTLVYNTGGTYTSGSEWTTASASAKGVPQAVTIQNNTAVNFGSSAAYRQANNLLTIGSGSSLTLSSASGGDLRIAGGLTNNNAANNVGINTNGRALQTMGAGTYTKNGVTGGTDNLDFLIIGSANTLTIASNTNLSLTNTAASGALQFNAAGTLAMAGTNTVTLATGTTVAGTTAGTISGSSPAISILSLDGTCTWAGTAATVISVSTNVGIQVNAGLTITTAGRLSAGYLQINPGGFLGGTNPVVYPALGTLVYNHNSGTYGLQALEFPAVSGPTNLTVNANGASTGISFANNNITARTLAGTLTLNHNLTLSGSGPAALTTLNTIANATAAVNGTGNFTHSASGSFTTASTTGVNGTLTTSGTITLPTTTSFTFNNSTTSQVTGTLLPTTIAALTINNPAASTGTTITNNTLTISGTTTLTSGALVLPSAASNLVTFTGNITGTSGTITGSSTSNIATNGTLATVGLTFTVGGASLNNWTHNTTTFGSTALGLLSLVTINGTFSLQTTGAPDFYIGSTGGLTFVSGASYTDNGANNNRILQTTATGGTFTLQSGSNLATGNTSGITTSGTGAIQTTTRTFSGGANYTFNNTNAGAQAIGDALDAAGGAGKTGAITGNVLIANNSATGVTLNAGTTITVNSPGTFNVGVLNTSSSVLTAPATSVINGSANVNFLGNGSTNGSSLVTAHVNGVNGTIQNTGTISLNNVGNNNTNFTFNGSVAQTTGALMPATVNNLTFSNTLSGAVATPSVTLSSSVTTTGAITFAGGASPLGVVSIGANNSLTINGILTLSNASKLIGTSTSNLSIGGSGTITTSSLFLSAAAGALNNFTMNRSGVTLTVGAPLTVSGTYSSTAGVIAMSANTLNLNGPIAFGAATLTSTGPLTIGGSGAITGSLLGTSNPLALSTLTMGRTGATLNLGTPITLSSGVGALALNAGIINLGANDLTLNNTAGTVTTSGTLSNTTMVKADGTGRLGKLFATGVSSFTFPIGDVSGPSSIADYSPATLAFSANSNATGIFYARVVNTAATTGHPQLNLTGNPQANYLDRYWVFSTGGTIGTYTYQGTFNYVPADINGTETSIKADRYNGTSWSEIAGSSAASNVLTTASGLTNATASLSATSEYTGRVEPSAISYVWNGSSSNDWATATNWTPNGIPSATDDVTINVTGGFTNCSINSGSKSVNNFTLNGTGAIAMVAGTSLTIDGSVTYGGSATANFDCSSTLNIASVTSQTIPALNYGNLNLTGGARVLASSGTIGICGTFTRGAGAFTITGSTVDFNAAGAQTVPIGIYNNLTISGARSSNSVTLGSGTVSVAGTFSALATAVTYVNTGNTFDFNGTGTQTIGAFANYNNLTISGARGTATITLASGTIGVAGTFNPSATGTITYSSTGNTFDYTSAGSQTITGFNKYNNLSNSGNGARTLAITPTIVIDGTYTPTTAAVTVGTSTIDFSSAGTQTMPATFYYAVTNSGNGSRTWANSGTIDINDGFSPSTATNTITGSTVRYSSTAAATTFTLSSFNTNVPNRLYNNLILVGAAGTIWQFGNSLNLGCTGNFSLTGSGTLNICPNTTANTMTVDGNFLLGSSSGNINVASSSGAGTLNVGGTFTHSGTGFFTVTGSIGLGALTVAGDMNLSGTAGTLRVTNNLSAPSTTIAITGNLNISNTARIQMEATGTASTATTITVGGNFTSTASGTTTNSAVDWGIGAANSTLAGNNITVSGNFTKSGVGTFYTTGGTAGTPPTNFGFIFNKTGTQTFSYSGAASDFTCYTINASSTLQLTADFAMGVSTSAPQTTFSVNGVYDMQTFKMSGMSPSANAVFTLASGATLKTANTLGINNGTASSSLGGLNATATKTYNPAANYEFNGVAAQNTNFPAAVTTVNNITFNNTSAVTPGVTLNQSISLAGSLSLTNGIVQLGANNLTVTNSASAAVSGGSATDFIQTNSTGELRRAIATGANTYNFPVGTSTNYTPVSYAFSANAAAFSLNAKSIAAIHPQMTNNGAQTDYLSSRYWTTNTSGSPSTYTYVSTFSFGGADLTGTAANLKLNRWNGSSWLEDAGSSTSSTTITSGSLTETTGSLTSTAEWTGRVNPTIFSYTWVGGTGSATTDYNTAANWNPIGIPSAGDNVTINDGTFACIISSGTFAVTNFTLNGTGNFQMTSTSTLSISGTVTSGGSATATFACGTTLNITSTLSQTIPAFNYGNLNLTGGARVLANSGIIGICGTFTPGAGAYTNSGSTVDFNGTGAQTVNARNYNNLSISGAHTTNSITLSAGSIGIAGTFSPTATFSSGAYSITGNTIDYNGTGAQTVAAFPSYNNLTISGARASATVTLASGTIGVGGTFNPSATAVTYTSAGNTFDYTSAGSQTIAVFSQYNNLSNSGNGARTLANGIIAVYGAYTPTSAAITVGTSTVDFAGAAGQTIPASFYYNITNSSNTNRTWANAGIIDIKNAFTPTSATNTITGSTIQYSATSGTLNLTTFTTNVASRNYNNLIFNGTGGTWTLNANTIGVANYLTVSAGNLILGVAAGAGTLNVDGNLTVSGGTLNTSNTTTAGTINLLGNLTVSSGTFTKTGTGVGTVNLIKSAGAQIFSQSGGTISNANAWNFGNGTTANTIQIASNVSASTGVFNVNTGTTVDFGMNTLTVTSGAFNLNSGATLNTTNAAGITTAGATGSILRSSGSNTFSASANYIFGGAITGTGFTGANNLTINNASGVILSSAATVNGTLTFTNGLLDIAAVNLTIGLSGSITGVNTTKYVKTSGAGQLKMTVASSNVVFPVGRSAYNPLTLNNSGTSDVFGVVLTDAISQSLNNSSLVVNRSWNITENIAGGSNLSIVTQWNGAAEQAAGFAGGTTPSIAYWNGSAWVQTGATQAGANPFTFTSTANLTGIASATYSIAIGKDDAFICTSAPTVSLVLPTSGYSGDVITINGTGLTGLTSATIGGTAATILSQSGASATLSVGAGATGVITVSKSAVCSASGSQTFTFNGFISAQTGNWSLGSTWQGGVVPPDFATVTIANSHVVTVDDLTNPASVIINAGAELTGTDDAQQLFVGSTGNGPVSVTGALSLGTALVSNGWLVCGTLSVNNGGIFNNNCGNAIAAGLNVTSLTLASGATYNHNALGSTLNGTLSDFPGLTGGTNISINSNANVNITKWAQNGGVPVSLPSVSGGQWGNVTVNITGQTYTGSWQNSGILTNATSLNIVNTGSRDFRLVTPTGSAGFTCTIGSVNVSGGIFIVIGGGSTGSGVVTMNVTNDFNVSGGVASIHGTPNSSLSYNTTGVTLNVSGNLNITGGSFYGHANPQSNTAAVSSSLTTLNVTGNLSINNGTLNLAYLPNYNFAGNTGNVNLNVKGNFTLGSTGILRNSNSIAPLGKTTATVNFNHASAQQTWTQTGTIQDVIGFNVNGTANTLQLLSNANIGTSTTSSFNVANATTFDLQAFVLGGSGTFTSAAGSSLKLGNANGITTIPTLSGNVQLLTSRTFDAATNYTYSGSINQITGNALPSIIIGAFTIANTGAASNNTVTLSTTGTTASTFNLTSGLFAAGTGQQLNIASGGTVSATSGDFATGATSGILNFPGTGTFSGNSNPYNVFTSGGVNFGAGTVTIQPAGTFRINSGGFVNTNAPFYASGSKLQYYSTGVYGRNLEWRASSGRGYPHHVQVSNSTTLNPGANSNTGQPFNTGGNLTIDAGSNIYMDYGGLNMTVPLSVIGGLNLNGNLSLSGSIGGDVNVAGNWTNNGTASNFFPNNRAVTFNGSINQNIGGTNTNANPFAFVTINNAAGVTLTFGQQINNQLAFNNGTLSLGNFDLFMNGLNIPITGFNNSRFIVTNGSGNLYRNFNSTSTIYPVGPSSTSYNPLTLSQLGTADNIGVRVATTPSFSNSINDNNQMVLVEYFLSEVTPGGNNLATSFQWNSTNEGSTFNRSGGVYQANWDGFNWVVRPSLTTSGSDPYTSTSTVNYTGNLINTAMIVGNINGIYSCISTASNGSWSNPNIWLSGIVPPADASVCINNPITLVGSDVNIANVTINSSGSLTVDPNINLNIADLGGIINNSGATTSLGQGNVVFTGIGSVSGSNSVTIKNLTLNRNTTLTATTTIDGNLTLNSGAFIIAGSPTYSATSTLIYATGGNYTSSNEWNANASVAGLGTPQNVLLNGTNLSLASGNRGLLGDLTINSGALSLNSSSGDLYVGGNWNRASTATFNSNNRAVLFTGAANQTITTNGGGNETFTYLIANKTSGNLVLNNSPATNVIVGASSGNVLEIASGNTIDLNGQLLSLTGTGGIINLPSGPTSIIGSSGSVFSISNGLKTITPSIGSSIDFGANVTVALNSGFNFGATTSTINGTLQIANGGFISTNPPSYAAGSTLRYFTGNSFNRGLEWSTNSGPGYPHHVLVDLNSTVTTLNLAPGAAACQIAGNLTVNNGAILNMGAMANPLVVLGDVTVGGASSGTLSLSSVAGGDIKIGGNLTRNVGGTLTQNSREVEMNGTVTQNISGVPIFAYLAINNSAASVKINDNTSINTRLRLSNGVFDLNSLGCTLANGSKIVRINGTMSAAPTVLGTNIYDLEYQNSVISSVEYLASSTAVRDLIITSGNTLTLGDNCTFNRDLTLSGGDLNLGGYTLTARGRATAPSFSGSITVSGGGVRSITGPVGSIFEITGLGANLPNDYTKTVSSFAGSTLSFDSNVLVRIGDGAVDFGVGSPTTINGTLQVLLAGSVGQILNPCYYGVNSLLRFSNTVDYQVGSNDKTWASGAIASGNPGIPYNVEVMDANTDLQLQSTRALRGNLTITDGTFTLTPAYSGSFNIGGNWTRSGATSAFNHNSKKVVFDRQTAGSQTITLSSGISTETFYDLEVSLFSGNLVTAAASSLTISNNLNFISGKIDLGANRLTIGTGLANGTITGANSSKYVITNAVAGGGNIKAFTNSNTAYAFPVGDATNYSPMSVTLTNGAQVGSYISTTAVQGIHPNLLTGAPPTKYISRYWSVEPSGLAIDPVYDVSYSYVVADEVGTGTLYPVKYSTSTTTPGWLSCPGSPAAAITGTSGANDNVLKTFTWNGLTTFSDFSGAGDGSPLPVTWLNFDAQFNNTTNNVDVSWTTASEINNDYFEVMRSVDAVNFEVVGTVDGAGNSSLVKDYTFVDANPLTGLSYYKIRQVDFNGQSDNTEIRAVSNLGGVATGTLFTYPNPLIGQDLTIVYSNLDKGNWEYRLVDITGKIVLAQNRTSDLNAGAFTLNLEQLPAGIYLFQLNTQSQNFTRKITISK